MSLCPKDFGDLAALVSIAERRFDDRAKDQRHDGCDKQGSKVLAKEGTTRARYPTIDGE
jgi:hypothetical protein